MSYPEYETRPPAGRSWPLLLLLGLLAGLLVYRATDRREARPPAEPRAVAARGDMAADEQATIDIFRENVPSVVFITTLRQRVDFFTRDVTQIPQGTGSGVIWDEHGHIVTNFHVIQQATGAQVTLHDQSTYSAELVGVAPSYDLAVLRIRGLREQPRPIPLGSSADLQVGQKTFAIGNPFGLDQTLTSGIVSALGRTIPAVTGRPIEDVIQTDAAINPGNSGGPLLDSAGRMIGLNTAIFSPSGAYAGIGFAVPVDTVNRIVPQLIAQGRVVRPHLGIMVNDQISQQLTRQMGIEGLVVLGVEAGSPAHEAGLRPTQRAPDGSIIPGDVIQQINGRPVGTTEQMFATLERHQPGDTVTMTIYRDGRTMEVEITLAAPAE